VPLAVMYLQRVGDLAVAWRRRRMYWPLFRRLCLRHRASAWPPASAPRYYHVCTYLIVVPRPVPRPLPAAAWRCRSRRKTIDTSAEEQSKYYQLHLHRGKVLLAATCLQRVGDLAVAWRHRRRRRMF
jgi:hypothetical protein